MGCQTKSAKWQRILWTLVSLPMRFPLCHATRLRPAYSTVPGEVAGWRHHDPKQGNQNRAIAGRMKDAKVALLRIADRAGFVDFLSEQADVGGAWVGVPLYRTLTTLPSAGNLAPAPVSVVFVSQPPLRLRFNINKGVSLRGKRRRSLERSSRFNFPRGHQA